MRTGAAEARQLRQRVLSANRAGLRLPHDEAVRLLAPGTIGSRSVRPEQVADAVLAHHGLVASPRLATTGRVDLVHIGLSRVLAFQGAVSVAVCAGVLGFVLRPVYGLILFIAGMASTAVLWTAPMALERFLPKQVPRGRLLGVTLGGIAVAVAFVGIVLPLRAHYQSIGAPPGVLGARSLYER